MKLSKKLLSFLLAIIMIASVSPLNAFAETNEETEPVNHALILQSDGISVAKRKTIQITAKVTNTDVQPKISASMWLLSILCSLPSGTEAKLPLHRPQ